MVPATTDRDTMGTPPPCPNPLMEPIQKKTRENVARYAAASPQLLEQRLRELDQEWDTEQVTLVTASVGLLLGLALAATLDRVWLVLPALFAVALLFNALFGWSPGLPLLRLLGYRTAKEINHERYALKALRGDFQPLAIMVTPQDREDLARFEGEGGPPASPPSHDAGNPAVVEEALRAVQN